MMMDDQIHWFSIINSVMIVLFLSGMVAMIMLRTLARDITKYNQLESQDDAQEETGWKLVGGAGSWRVWGHFERDRNLLDDLERRSSRHISVESLFESY